MTLARSDREFTNEEMALLSELMDRLVKELPLDRALTIQESNVLRALRDGRSHKEIAADLDIGISTVRLRLNTARQKLGAGSNTAALTTAMQRNLL